MIKNNKRILFLLSFVLLVSCTRDTGEIAVPINTATPVVLSLPPPTPTKLIVLSSDDASGEILVSDNHGVYSIKIDTGKVTVINEDTFHITRSVNVRKGDIFFLRTVGTEYGPEDLFMLDGNSQELIRLTNDNYWDFDLSASPDGVNLAYVSDRYLPDSPDLVSLDNRYKVILYNRITNEESVLFEGDDQFAIKWSPVDSKLAILSLPVDEEKHRLLIILDTESKKIINSYEITGSTAFNWSPDGLFLAIGGFSQNKIAIINVETNSIKLFDIPKKLIGGIAWSPDGNSILLQNYDALTNQDLSDLVLLEINTGNLTQLFNGKMHPGTYLNKFTWSPDGDYIAFITLDEYDKVNIMNISTLQISKLDFSYYFSEFLVWIK